MKICVNAIKVKMLHRKSIVYIVIVFLIGCVLYFKPLRLSDLINENQEICITAMEFAITNGKSDIDSKNYNEITVEQKNDIISLFQNYSYRRTIFTAFSDGSMSDLGNIMVLIYTYEDGKVDNTIYVSAAGDISVNNKNYVLANAPEFIQELLEIIN